MSKCDLAIVFDRAEREYHPGEEVTGTVHVQVNQDVQCDGMLLEHFWQTHGRGNTATGPKQTTVLFKGRLQAGQSLSYPFRFTAPDGPPTYHGRYLNVDHYVHLRVDVPWAIDPRLKEDYLLLPGTGRYGHLPSLTRRNAGVAQAVSGCGVPVGAAMILAGLFLFFPCGLVLIPLGLVVLFFALRKVIAEKKIGKVNLSFGSSTVAPGSRLPVRLAFTPNQSSRLNRITAELVGSERCVSGSGTNRTTHTHKFHQRTFMLVSECEMTAGRPIQVEGAVPIPETTAYSFHARDNDVIWELEVRVDIPFWPDWIEKRPVIVRPPTGEEVVEVTVVEEPSARAPIPVPIFPGVEEAPPTVRPPRAEPAARSDRAEPGPAPRPEPLVAPEPEPSAEAVPSVPGEPFEELPAADLPVEEPPAPEPAPAETPPPEAPVEPQPAPDAEGTDPVLVGLVGRIAAADRYSRDREQIIEENAERPFPCEIEITRMERTYSYIPDARFRQGRTVTGKLRGTECEVAVQLVASRNDEIDALQPGNLLHAACKPLKWNTIYDRLEMREA